MSRQDFEKRLSGLGRGPAFRFDPERSALNTSERVRGRRQGPLTPMSEFACSLGFIAALIVFILLTVEGSPFAVPFALIAFPGLVIWGVVLLVLKMRREEMSLLELLGFLFEYAWRPLRALVSFFD